MKAGGRRVSVRKESIRTQDAVGKIIAHDITRIVQGKSKGAVFRKGHKIEPQDIDVLLDVGKEHIYTLTLEEDDVHEDEAGIRLGRALCGEGMYTKGPSESRINLFAEYPGLLRVNREVLHALNALPDVICATLPDRTPVEKDQMLAGTKVVPLVVKEQSIRVAEEFLQNAEPALRLLPFRKHKVGCVVTGSEVYHKRIEDSFAPVITEKIEHYGSEILEITYAPDDEAIIRTKILELKEKGADLIFTTGGMSVDPDDLTPSAIRSTGAEIVTYGTPVLPGAMFMVAYLENVPVLGVPGSGMFFRHTVLDLLLPRVLAGERITKEDIVSMGEGGLLPKI